MKRMRTTSAIVGALLLGAMIAATLPMTDTAARASVAAVEDASVELELLGANTVTSVSADCYVCFGRKGQCSVPGRYPELCGTVGALCLCSWCEGTWGCHTPL